MYRTHTTCFVVRPKPGNLPKLGVASARALLGCPADVEIISTRSQKLYRPTGHVVHTRHVLICIAPTRYRAIFLCDKFARLKHIL